MLPQSRYTRSGASLAGQPLTGLVDARKVIDLFEGGATVVLQGLQRYWPPLTRLVAELELALGHPCQANAYLTPPGSQGFAVHSDTHDVFVFQTHGSKLWEVHAAPGEEAEAREVLLEPGLSMYLPTGTPHAARAQGHGLAARDDRHQPGHLAHPARPRRRPGDGPGRGRCAPARGLPRRPRRPRRRAGGAAALARRRPRRDRRRAGGRPADPLVPGEARRLPARVDGRPDAAGRCRRRHHPAPPTRQAVRAAARRRAPAPAPRRPPDDRPRADHRRGRAGPHAR